MMKYIISILILVLSTLVSGQGLNPFDSIDYDKVIAYEFQGEGARMITYCLENEPRRISKTLELTESQLDPLLRILTSDSSYGNITAACFDPHLAIVYYRNEDILATIDICLDCNYLSSSIEIPATKSKSIKVDEEFSYPARGFSKATRNAIRKFCTDIGFTKYLKSFNPMFDE